MFGWLQGMALALDGWERRRRERERIISGIQADALGVIEIDLLPVVLERLRAAGQRAALAIPASQEPDDPQQMWFILDHDDGPYMLHDWACPLAAESHANLWRRFGYPISRYVEGKAVFTNKQAAFNKLRQRLRGRVEAAEAELLAAQQQETTWLAAYSGCCPEAEL